MPAAAPQPPSQEEILESALAALTATDIPPGDDAWAVPDPDCGRPAELAGLAVAELDQLIAAAPAPVLQAGSGGFVDRDGTGRGAGSAGFGQDGVLDVMAAGMALAGFADEAHARLGALSDDELVGVLRAWRRQTSWAQARELAAIAELARRRPADRTPPAAPGEFPAQLSEFVADEVAMALTLTQRGAEQQLDLALDLAARPATAAALAAGRIDLYKTRIILDAVGPLSAEHAAAVEASVLPAAEGQTSGQLRAAVHRAVLLLDPGAERRRREEAQRGARVECWANPDGTATLTGRWLPPAEVLAADKRLCQVAAWWKKQIRAAWKLADPGQEMPRPEHGTDLLRARAYLALLLGQPVDTPPADLLPPAEAPGPGGPVGPDHPPGPAEPAGPATADGLVPPGLRRRDPVAGLPPLAGSVNVTLAPGHPARLVRPPGRGRRIWPPARRHRPRPRQRRSRPPGHQLGPDHHRPARPGHRLRPRPPRQTHPRPPRRRLDHHPDHPTRRQRRIMRRCTGRAPGVLAHLAAGGWHLLSQH